MAERILIVDDEASFREAFARFLRGEGFECATAEHAGAALARLKERAYDVVFSDISMPGASGTELLARISEAYPDTFTILMTAYGSYETALQAIRHGAFDYVPKPLSFEEALFRIRRIVEHRDRLLELRMLRVELGREFDFENIVGRAPRMKEVFALIRKLARTKSTVLVTGESGTGKELVARAVHHHSELTRDHRFVAVNCAALPDTLLESELFGHTRGAFTGATSEKKGLFELAEGGSIFLDEIGETSGALQAKLLRVLQEREIVRVGGTTPIRVDARVICSTHRSLPRMVEEKKFREDLYFRINVVEVRMPALRDRREDIPLLVQQFLRKHAREFKRPVPRVDPEALRGLSAYDWPGNVRELENVLERAMILGDGERIKTDDLPPALRPPGGRAAVVPLKEAVRTFERRHVEAVLEELEGDKTAAARRLGIGLSSLYRKLGTHEPE